MNPDDVVEKVCRLLISDSGIRKCPAALTSANIEAHLRSQAALVDHWLKWSANKRVTSGWYFARRSGRLVVGFHPQGETLTFDDPVVACSEFVVREVSAITEM